MIGGDEISEGGLTPEEKAMSGAISSFKIYNSLTCDKMKNMLPYFLPIMAFASCDKKSQEVAQGNNAAACSYTLAPSETVFSVAATEGTRSVSVTAAPADCQWRVDVNARWIAVSSADGITVSAGQTLVGSKNLNFSYTRNPSNTSRTGTITIAERKYTVNQAPLPLLWEDDFNGTSLDLAHWIYRYPGVRHDGYNDATTVSVSDGNLFIKVYTDQADGATRHHTGMIATKKEFKYGKFEVRAAFVNQSGSWSAFWLQSPSIGKPAGNPQQAGMEIDVVETLPGDGRVYHNLHWDGYGADHKAIGIKTKDIGANSGNYHTYTLEWTPAYYKFYVDGELTWTYSDNVSQRSEFIIFSTEVRNHASGSWAGPIPQNGYGSLADAVTVMKVDYVKCYGVQ